ncbi:hypothetical protein L596_010639 [Steinernema carpocapsae]|uniref:Uncharacterized protein n=1 Tax=Steinernema carpocapsae TaxID=34508 RepID=A0A4U5PIW2_STECR|nr:hypothetical protein L596_010639 [Steinernema carpocapsae]
MDSDNCLETKRIVDALVYNHVKRLNPGALVEIFSEERCKELERDDHRYSSKSLLKMLRFYHKKVPTITKRTTIRRETVDPKRCPAKIPANRARIQEFQVKPEEPKREVSRKRKMTEPEEPKRSQNVPKKQIKVEEDQPGRTGTKPVEQALEKPKRELFGHQKFCEITSLSKATDLALFSHFTRKNQGDVLEELFEADEIERYRSLDKSINVPTIQRCFCWTKSRS